MSTLLFLVTVLLGFPSKISTKMETKCKPSQVYYLHHDLHVQWSNYELFQVWKVSQADSCKQHHFCPDWFGKTDILKYIPCGYGFYNNKRDSTSPNDCLPCPAGKYCFAGVFDCPIGYYCMENGLAKEPWQGFSAPTKGLSEPVACTPGYYQPVIQYREWEWQGVDECLTCPRYRFCDVSKLAAPAGECDLGWYCERGETSPRPAGKECPPGSYCVKGKKVECEVGYYQPYEKMIECFECPEGKKCTSTRLSAPSGSCDPGFFCTANLEQENPCPAGHMCIDGVKIPCGDGHYQDEGSQTTCKRCPVGSYCKGTAQTSITGSCDPGCCLEDGQIKSDACPPASPTNCSRGYYKDEDGVCSPCPEGKYCAISGLSAPSGSCEPRWYCEEGETVPAPNGKYCPAGHKCPEGIKIPCGYENDRYYYQPAHGQTKCLVCPWYYNCTEPGLDRLKSLCKPGYKCRHGQIIPCPNGKYCNGGEEFYCWEGYKPSEGRDTCVRCDPGYHCKKGIQNSCPANRICYNGLSNYCELGFTCSIVNGELVKTPCPPGTERYQLDSDTCVPCRQYRYCRSGSSYECFRYHKGFGCSGGASTPFANVAQPGQYYELVYQTYEKNRGYEIKDCAPGTYQPDKHRSSCIVCPAQFMCPAGSSAPVSCPGNQPLEGQSKC